MQRSVAEVDVLARGCLGVGVGDVERDESADGADARGRFEDIMMGAANLRRFTVPIQQLLKKYCHVELGRCHYSVTSLSFTFHTFQVHNFLG